MSVIGFMLAGDRGGLSIEFCLHNWLNSIDIKSFDGVIGSFLFWDFMFSVLLMYFMNFDYVLM